MLSVDYSVFFTMVDQNHGSTLTLIVNLVVPPPIDIFIGATGGGDADGGGENVGEVGVVMVRPAASADG